MSEQMVTTIPQLNHLDHLTKLKHVTAKNSHPQ